MPEEHLRLAALQMIARAGDRAANLALIEDAARGAVARGASLLLTPELSTTGYGAGPALLDLAEPADGPTAASLADIARRNGIALVAGFPERAGAAIYNAVLYTDGGAPTVYRKSQLYGTYEKKLFAVPPPSTVLVRHRGLSFGLLVCYDVEFPENVRRLALAGADAVLVPTALPAGPSNRFIAERMIAVRAFENQIFVAYADHAGGDGRFAYAGLSRIVAPDGGVLASAPEEGALLVVADIDPDAYRRSRADNSYLADLGALRPATRPCADHDRA